jgi:hypothetical protein
VVVDVNSKTSTRRRQLPVRFLGRRREGVDALFASREVSSVSFSFVMSTRHPQARGPPAEIFNFR